MARKNKKNGRKRQKRKTIVLNIPKNEYENFLSDRIFCRDLILERLEAYPELFPVSSTPKNLQLNGSSRVSKKSGYRLKQVIVAGVYYEIRPSWLLSYHRGECADVKWGIFLIRHGVPFWVVAMIFGMYAMYWYRLFISFSQNSIVGTTVKRVPIPVDLLADEEHSRTKGKKSYIGTTIAKGCILGVRVVKSACESSLKRAYKIFKQEALNIDPNYQADTFNIDGWKPLFKVLRELWPKANLMQCILHAWIKIRDRATKKLQFSFDIASEKFWDCYKAVNKQEFSQRVRRLRQWTTKNVEESAMKTNILDFCNKRDKWKVFYDYPQAHRTSNMLDRIMKQMSRFIFNNQYFHASNKSATKLMRSFALVHNFSPWSPWTVKLNEGWKSPFERLNKFRYVDDWFENFMMATSLNGYKNYHCKTL